MYKHGQHVRLGSRGRTVGPTEDVLYFQTQSTARKKDTRTGLEIWADSFNFPILLDRSNLDQN